MDRCLQQAAAGQVQAPIKGVWGRLVHRGLVEVVDYRPGRLRQCFALTARGRAELARKGERA